MTVTGTEEDVGRFYVEEFKEVPEWAYEIYVKGVEGIQFRLWSRWQPDFAWLEGLLQKYPSLWVKNIWHEEGGTAGVWIGGGAKDGIKRLEWDDMCDEENAHRFREA
jgi:hypothetical protein